MPRVEVSLSVVVRGALSVGAISAPQTVASRHLLRDAMGRPLLPGSHVKGRLRHACEQIARTLSLPVCRAPRAHTMCPRSMNVAAPPCVVCALFGSPAWPSPLRWGDLPCLDAPPLPVGGAAEAAPGAAERSVADPEARPMRTAPLATDLRAGVALNRRRGTAENTGPFFVETTPPLPGVGLRFGSQRAAVGQLAEPARLHLLLAGCRLVASFGSGETRGLGWSDLVAAARVDGEPVAFEPSAVGYQPPASSEAVPAIDSGLPAPSGVEEAQ